MGKQLDLFYEAYRANFYKGVKERYAKIKEDFDRSKNEPISINLKGVVQFQNQSGSIRET